VWWEEKETKYLGVLSWDPVRIVFCWRWGPVAWKVFAELGWKESTGEISKVALRLNEKPTF
jgi:hypothetical protein